MGCLKIFERFPESQVQNGLENYHFISFSTKIYLCLVQKWVTHPTPQPTLSPKIFQNCLNLCPPPLKLLTPTTSNYAPILAILSLSLSFSLGSNSPGKVASFPKTKILTFCQTKLAFVSNALREDVENMKKFLKKSP
jgi:hypothetical protein